MNPPTRPEGVLILSNDFLTPFAKTSDYLAEAIERRGIPAYVRDNADARLLTFLFPEEMAAADAARAGGGGGRAARADRVCRDRHGAEPRPELVRHAGAAGRRRRHPRDPFALVRRFSQLVHVAAQPVFSGRGRCLPAARQASQGDASFLRRQPGAGGAAARRHAPAAHPAGRAARVARARRPVRAHGPAGVHRQSRLSRHAARGRDQADGGGRGPREAAQLQPRRDPEISRASRW